MEIVISKSKRPDKQLGARIDNKQRFHLDRKGHWILHSIKITSENNDMLIDINEMD